MVLAGMIFIPLKWYDPKLCVGLGWPLACLVLDYPSLVGVGKVVIVSLLTWLHVGFGAVKCLAGIAFILNRGALRCGKSGIGSVEPQEIFPAQICIFPVRMACKPKLTVQLQPNPQPRDVWGTCHSPIGE